MNLNSTKIINQLLSKVDKADIVSYKSIDTTIDFEMDELKSLEDSEHSGIGIRLFENGKVGNAYVNQEKDLDTLLVNAKESASYGDMLDIDLPTTHMKQIEKSQNIEKTSKEDLLKVGKELVYQIKNIEKTAKVSASISKDNGIFDLWNTNDAHCHYEDNEIEMYGSLFLAAADGFIEIGKDANSFEGIPDIKPIVSMIEQRYNWAKKNVSVKSGNLPVIFTPEAQGVLWDTFLIAMNGKTLYKKSSLFKGKENTIVTNSKVTIKDDISGKDSSMRCKFDDEGSLIRPYCLIDHGEFQDFICDLTIAERVGKATTSHASRSLQSLPSPSYHHLSILPGQAMLEEMIKDIDYGLLVTSFLGEGMSNVIAGDFSVNVEMGYLIEKGQIKGRVKDVMLSGNAFDLLKQDIILENKSHKLGNMHLPHILVPAVSVTA